MSVQERIREHFYTLQTDISTVVISIDSDRYALAEKVHLDEIADKVRGTSGSRKLLFTISMSKHG